MTPPSVLMYTYSTMRLRKSQNYKMKPWFQKSYLTINQVKYLLTVCGHSAMFKSQSVVGRLYKGEQS